MNPRSIALSALLLFPLSPRGRTLPPGMTPRIVEAARKGLDWLARNQNRDGSWRSSGTFGTVPVAMTSMAGLAFLASGSTPTRGPYAPVVQKALHFLLRNVHASGLIATQPPEMSPMYGHGFAMLFLAEAYGMEEDARKQAAIRRVLERAVRLTAAAQSMDGGWYYSPTSQTDEGSVTVTQIQALRACRDAGIPVPKKVIDGAIRYIVRSSNPDGGIRYRVHQGGRGRPAITAAAVAVFYEAGRYDHPLAEKALAYARRFLPPSRPAGSFYFYAHNYLAQALYQRGGKEWLDYYGRISKHLLSVQRTNGSWTGSAAGPVYATSVSLIILQLPFGYVPAFQR